MKSWKRQKAGTFVPLSRTCDEREKETKGRGDFQEIPPQELISKQLRRLEEKSKIVQVFRGK